MKMSIAVIAFAILALTRADVSHLTKKYLPPVQQSFSGSPITYSSSHVQPVNEYLPPVNRPSYTTTFSQSGSGAVDTTYSAPALSGPSFVSYPSHALQQTYSSPSTDYLPPVQQTYSVPTVQTTFTAPAVQAATSFGFSGPAGSFGSNDAVGTQYSSNGGYVYRK